MQPGIVGQQGAQVRLAGQVGGQHVADVERLRSQSAGILDGGLHGLHGQRAQGNVPVLADGGLSDSSNDDISHSVSKKVRNR